LLEKFDPGKRDQSEASPILSAYSNVADQYARAHQLDDALRVCKRAEDFARLSGRDDYIPDLLWIEADVLRRRGDLDRALEEVDRAVKMLEPGAAPSPRWRTINLILALIIRGEILGEENALSFGRSADAIESLDRAFRLADEFVHQDPVDEMVRSRVANAATVMGAILRTSDPSRALDIYDHTLRHIAEIKDNTSFRRFEVSLLGGSSYALQRLGRSTEARQRLDAAFERLKTLQLYPAEKIKLGSEADEALRALADFEAGAGNLPRAIEIYQELSSKILASKPDAESYLADAVRLSGIFREQSILDRRAGQTERALTLDAHLRDLWQQWDRKLPNNAFIGRELSALAATPQHK
jgi:tetratricopeptide (TPR) repeat protein